MTGAASRPGQWRMEHFRGSARGFHGRELPHPVTRSVWWFETVGPAVALGSAQALEVVDASAAAAAGVEVVRRRSGGGVVWLAPGAVTWVDVVLPSGDPHWVDDVGRSAGWLGQAWALALADLGLTGAAVHDGPIERTAHSVLVCFAGLAPGEVTMGGRKVVGISQRRTRRGARFQCAVLHTWDPRPLIDVLALPTADQATDLAADLAGVAVGIGSIAPRAVVAALVARLNADT